MDYKLVVGLEIHIQINTKSKMFCRCSTDYFEAIPNTNVCEVCLGLPGALPIPNKSALEKTIKLALALNCSITQKSKFDRKNYFYPDLPKGYQISQFDYPIGKDGYVEIEVEGDSRRVRIQRVHLEEDTGKSLHNGEETLLDYNKSGIPLIEVVTYPDFESIQEVVNFAKRLRQIVRYNDISEAHMQKGHMRFELNISVLGPNVERNQYGLPNYKVEVKNIGSISVLEKVLHYEFERQVSLLNKGTKIKSETRGLKGMSGETVFQRYKESNEDYRYFPEPDIPPFEISDELLFKIQNSMPEQPVERKLRYISIGLEQEQADIFVEDTQRGDWFDKLIEYLQSANNLNIKEVVKWILGDLSGTSEKFGVDFLSLPFDQKWFLHLMQLYYEQKITGTNIKKIIVEEIKNKSIDSEYSTKLSPIEIAEIQNYLLVEDNTLLESTVSEVIQENSRIVEDIKKNPNAIKALVGIAMKKSKGKLNPQKIEESIRKVLSI